LPGLSTCDNIRLLIKRFADAGTEDIFLARSTRLARKVLPISLHAVGRRKLAMLDAAPTLDSLRIPPGNRLETLRGYRAGTFAIRINERFRVCFAWEEGHAADVEIVDYH